MLNVAVQDLYYKSGISFMWRLVSRFCKTLQDGIFLWRHHSATLNTFLNPCPFDTLCCETTSAQVNRIQMYKTQFVFVFHYSASGQCIARQTSNLDTCKLVFLINSRIHFKVTFHDLQTCLNPSKIHISSEINIFLNLVLNCPNPCPSLWILINKEL